MKKEMGGREGKGGEKAETHHENIGEMLVELLLEPVNALSTRGDLLVSTRLLLLLLSSRHASNSLQQRPSDLGVTLPLAVRDHRNVRQNLVEHRANSRQKRAELRQRGRDRDVGVNRLLLLRARNAESRKAAQVGSEEVQSGTVLLLNEHADVDGDKGELGARRGGGGRASTDGGGGVGGDGEGRGVEGEVDGGEGRAFRGVEGVDQGREGVELGRGGEPVGVRRVNTRYVGRSGV